MNTAYEIALYRASLKVFTLELFESIHQPYEAGTPLRNEETEASRRGDSVLDVTAGRK